VRLIADLVFGIKWWVYIFLVHIGQYQFKF